VDEKEERNLIPCIVDEGLLANRQDMIRVLRDLGHVKYSDIREGAVRGQGEGYIFSVFTNPNRATVFVNKRLYINVNSFNYLQLSKLDDGSAAIDLVDDVRTVRLVPVTDPLTERQRFMSEPAVQQGERIFAEDFAEVYQDEDYDDRDDD
jgi:hypothetical protein